MHTLIVIVIGLAILAASLLIGRQIGGSSDAMATAALAFLPLWLMGAGINMWIGVTRAGYSVKDEAPVLLVVFAVPAIVAIVLWWQFKGAH